mmetsp:Transcript_26461/g.79075  ORF Transcript_26461/g.79075 Transcript_26461/m.79075 type:complete len:423 (+) Transcript_26461:366-1634(+)
MARLPRAVHRVVRRRRGLCPSPRALGPARRRGRRAPSRGGAGGVEGAAGGCAGRRRRSARAAGRGAAGGARRGRVSSGGPDGVHVGVRLPPEPVAPLHHQRRASPLRRRFGPARPRRGPVAVHRRPVPVAGRADRAQVQGADPEGGGGRRALGDEDGRDDDGVAAAARPRPVWLPLRWRVRLHQVVRREPDGAVGARSHGRHARRPVRRAHLHPDLHAEGRVAAHPSARGAGAQPDPPPVRQWRKHPGGAVREGAKVRRAPRLFQPKRLPPAAVHAPLGGVRRSQPARHRLLVLAVGGRGGGDILPARAQRGGEGVQPVERRPRGLLPRPVRPSRPGQRGALLLDGARRAARRAVAARRLQAAQREGREVGRQPVDLEPPAAVRLLHKDAAAARAQGAAAVGRWLRRRGGALRGLGGGRRVR